MKVVCAGGSEGVGGVGAGVEGLDVLTHLVNSLIFKCGKKKKIFGSFLGELLCTVQFYSIRGSETACDFIVRNGFFMVVAKTGVQDGIVHFKRASYFLRGVLGC